MALLFDDAKKLEKAVGEEAAQIIVRLFEERDDARSKEAASRADLEIGLKGLEVRLAERIAAAEVRIAETKTEIIKWVAGLLLAQAAVIAALVKILA